MIENAPTPGIGVGYGPYLRDVIVSKQRACAAPASAIAVSVVKGEAPR